MTRIYIEPSGRRIEPFGDPVGEALILNRPLRDWQEEMLRDGRFERVGRLDPPCLVIPDTLLATGTALRRFVREAAGRDAVLVLKDSLFGRQQFGVIRETRVILSRRVALQRDATAFQMLESLFHLTVRDLSFNPLRPVLARHSFGVVILAR